MKTKSWLRRPVKGHFNYLHLFRAWLRDLGGDYTPLLTEPSGKRTGRRDPDKKPRQYDLPDEKYGMDPRTGTIWRRPE